MARSLRTSTSASASAAQSYRGSTLDPAFGTGAPPSSTSSIAASMSVGSAATSLTSTRATCAVARSTTEGFRHRRRGQHARLQPHPVANLDPPRPGLPVETDRPGCAGSRTPTPTRSGCTRSTATPRRCATSAHGSPDRGSRGDAPNLRGLVRHEELHGFSLWAVDERAGEPLVALPASPGSRATVPTSRPPTSCAATDGASDTPPRPCEPSQVGFGQLGLPSIVPWPTRPTIDRAA